MAKRAPAGEVTYRPLLDPSVISAALTKSPRVAGEPRSSDESAKVVGISRTEEAKREGRGFRPELSGNRNPSEPAVARPAAPKEAVEKLDQEKRMLLTRSESMALERLVNTLASRVNTQLKLSHVLRSLVTLLLHAESEIDRRARENVGLTRPANGDFNALQRFEKEIAKILAAAMRDSGPLRD